MVDMDKIKTIIVDDEAEAREGVELLLQNDDAIEVVNICKNGIEAIDSINEFKIDLMYLDIQMPVVDGFEVIKSVPQNRLPAIIFTTAYDQYTLKAFEVHALDYLLKPFTDARFFESLEQVKKIIRNSKVRKKHHELIKIVSDKNINKSDKSEIIQYGDQAEMNRLIVKEAGQVHFIDLGAIRWIEAYDYYVKIHVNDRFHLLRKSMKKMSEILPTDHFVRVHKSGIVNLQYIKNIKKLSSGDYEIQLVSGDSVKVSRGYKNVINHLIS